MTGPLVNATEKHAELAPGHPTATLYLDETGIVEHPADRYFGIGLLRVVDGHSLLRSFHALCQSAQAGAELHWASFDKGPYRDKPQLVEAAKSAIDLVFDKAEFSFGCLIADRQNGDVRAQFEGDPYPGHKAYEHVAANALTSMIHPAELVTVLADELSTPPAVHFERDVRAQVNRQLDRLAVVTVDRLDSRASPGLQLIDLLLGAAAYDLRVAHPDEEAQKRQISLHLLERMQVNSIRPRGRIAVDGKYRVELLSAPDKSRRGKRGGRRGRRNA